MDTYVRFIAQLVENPNFFKEPQKVEQGTIWDHWDQALPMLIAVGGIIILLIAYKMTSKYISKQFLSKILKKLHR